MLKSFKINTTLVICSAFIFRLLFININTISSLNFHQSADPAKSHFIEQTNKRQVEASATPETFAYSAAEICEEDANENSQFKSNPFVLIQVLSSLFADQLTSALNFHFFPKYLSHSSSDRYLTFRVFRI